MTRSSAAPARLTTRPVAPGDSPFLLALYAGTREREMAMVPWSERQKRDFLEMQFQAQSRFYAEAFPAARFSIVECGGERVGRLYVHEGPEEIRVIDISIAAAHRNRGFGTALMRDVFALADRTGRRVTVHVDRENEAKRWYDRLGFTHVREQGFYEFLERLPAGSAPCSTGSP